MLLYFFGFAFISPIALVAAPLALCLLFHRPGLRETAVAVLLLTLVAWSVTSAGDDFARFEAAWVLLLAGGTAVALTWGAPERGELVQAGLVTVGLAALAGVFLVQVTAFSWAQLAWIAERHYGGYVRGVLDMLAARASLTGTPDLALIEALRTTADAMVRAIGVLLPGLILIQSVAALAATWALYRMIARDPVGDRLPALREFRFNDSLVWGIVLALLALVLPGLGALRLGSELAHYLRLVGGNLATFFGGLYIARGLAVASGLAAAGGIGGPLVTVLSVIATVFFLPLVAFTALALGVSDTWIDWRKLAQRAQRR